MGCETQWNKIAERLLTSDEFFSVPLWVAARRWKKWWSQGNIVPLCRAIAYKMRFHWNQTSRQERKKHVSPWLFLPFSQSVLFIYAWWIVCMSLPGKKRNSFLIPTSSSQCWLERRIAISFPLSNATEKKHDRINDGIYGSSISRVFLFSIISLFNQI